ncbi:hypothetical protein [Commensalibacter papalotli (ex Botero et al. 2024)]|uniref:Uncharacterized protein n=1 Tax=Commensalibacter papalotli (ex Botero et al. 2024) TaxID=2972766 RepID=A0ABM9HME2_9PROT|nr:hypothetical protein [Commensalibacter papalotli (ex Botero et al. 2024)]CAI3934996.1 unnamed protein product [Commensalibacter papalotli (ex Botero et al. 2024)]CAI3951132.1 unnamed protein product [Commensalibacter papalotli (ex Botero et al. 2024)]
MRKKSFLWAAPALISMSLLASHLCVAQQPVTMTSPLPFPVPALLHADHSYNVQHINTYGNWSIIAGQPYASILWQQPNSSIKLFITPSDNMITIDVVAKKKENRAFKLPFITWNIKNVSVALNKISDHKGWVQFSTAVYTQNIDKLVSALESESPMTISLSTLSTIPVSTDGLRSTMDDFTRLIRQNNLIAPKPLAINEIKDDSFVPLDGMSPEIFPLYQETKYYVQQCLTMTNPGQEKARTNICMKRNDLLKQMKNKGWCWGSGDSDQHDKDKIWRKCIMSPKGEIEKIKENTKADFEKAKAMTNN